MFHGGEELTRRGQDPVHALSFDSDVHLRPSSCRSLSEIKTPPGMRVAFYPAPFSADLMPFFV
jgi:hypothetical protein